MVELIVEIAEMIRQRLYDTALAAECFPGHEAKPSSVREQSQKAAEQILDE
ncbi:hypothetical protein [Photobacterium sp. Hal280]|uniref:hypothetical protein n=1 Tax=Photobacterium sp. Hal280 TaxID=3035163 RepID=UPI00301DAE01